MKARYLYIIALLVVALDQATKYLATSRVPFDSSAPVIGDVVHITTVQNPGGAFGLFQSWAVLLTMITVAAVIVILALVRGKSPLPSTIGVGLALQLGGALGNLIDRVRFHYVVDFIQIPMWPVFNLADTAITAGIFLLAYYLFFCEGRRAKHAAIEGQ